MNYSDGKIDLAKKLIKGAGVEMERKFPTQVIGLIENNLNIINLGSEDKLTFITAYNGFPKYNLEPVELMRPYYYLYPDAKKFQPEFELYNNFFTNGIQWNS